MKKLFFLCFILLLSGCGSDFVEIQPEVATNDYKAECFDMKTWEDIDFATGECNEYGKHPQSDNMNECTIYIGGRDKFFMDNNDWNNAKREIVGEPDKHYDCVKPCFEYGDDKYGKEMKEIVGCE